MNKQPAKGRGRGEGAGVAWHWHWREAVLFANVYNTTFYVIKLVILIMVLGMYVLALRLIIIMLPT